MNEAQQARNRAHMACNYLGLPFYRSPCFRSGPNFMRIINAAGLAIIKEFEGCKLSAYQDGGGIWTCGYGHISGVNSATTCGPELAEKWLLEDLEITENLVSNEITIPLSDNQFSALVSFTFNEGIGHLHRSTIKEELEQKNYEGAADAILMWDKIRGCRSPGLDRRRQAERLLFIS